MQITSNTIEQAINDVNKGLSIRETAKKNNISRAYLRQKLLEAECKNAISKLEVHRQVKSITGKKAILFLCDIHYPYEMQSHIDLALEYANLNYSINSVVLGGDVLDCYAISRFNKDPSAMPLKDEFLYCATELQKLKSSFSNNVSFFYIKGNHEERLEKYIQTKAPELCGLKGLTISEQLGLAELGIEWIDNNALKRETGQFFNIGGSGDAQLFALHGHEIQGYPSTNHAHRFLDKARANIILGHAHTADEKFLNTIEGRVLRCNCVGTLANLFPSYRPANNWIAGFACVVFDEDGFYTVDNRKIINGRIV